MSVNYNRKFLSCELNSESSGNGDTLVKAPDYVYQDKEFTSETCTTDKCPTGDTCIEDSCKVTQCDAELKVKNGIVRGNMFDVGAQRVVECMPGYGLVSGHRIIKCTKKGSWENTTELRCEKVCPLPQQIDYGEIVHLKIMTSNGTMEYNDGTVLNKTELVIMNDSEVQYRCIEEKVIVNDSLVRCLDGQWSTYPICISYHTPCNDDAVCFEPGVWCNNGQCRCKKLEQYSYIERACVSECKYGLASTFQENERRSVTNGDFEYQAFVGLEKCRSICVSKTACKGFVYQTISHQCELHKKFYVNGDALSMAFPGISYYRRNCL
ncbi:hypothetical protein ACF0H5_020780 [Mactra antiquata]